MAWLTTTLVASGVAPPGARVVAVDHLPIGAGKVGRSIRFRLAWAGAGRGRLPRTVVGKFPAADPRSRRTGVDSDAYRRELFFYRNLAPRLAMSVPRCHAAEIDLSTGDFVVLMTDVAPARPGDQAGGASVDDIGLALAELPRLQAPFWGTAGLARHDWLPARAADGGRRLAALYRLLADGFVARFGDRLSAHTLSTLERFTPRVRRWLQADRPPFTVLHGDFRLENLLFGCGGGAPPVTVVDWQTVTVGSGPSDAAYLVGGSLSVPARRAAEDGLFGEYWRSLRAAGIDIGRADCWRAYRVNTLAGLHMTVVGAMLVGQDAHSDAMFVTMAERHAAHVGDLDPFALIDVDR